MTRRNKKIPGRFVALCRCWHSFKLTFLWAWSFKNGLGGPWGLDYYRNVFLYSRTPGFCSIIFRTDQEGHPSLTHFFPRVFVRNGQCHFCDTGCLFWTATPKPLLLHLEKFFKVMSLTTFHTSTIFVRVSHQDVIAFKSNEVPDHNHGDNLQLHSAKIWQGR